MLKFKCLEDACEFASEMLGEDIVFEDMAAVDLFEFHSDALADRIQRRTKLKDMVKSRDTKLQMKSDFSREKLSQSLIKFNQTAAGKRLRQRIQQLRKDGRYDKFETMQVLNNIQGALMQEARYSRDVIEEVHTELCVERLLSLTLPFCEAVLNDEIGVDEICVLMNAGELAESIDHMLNIEEGVVGSIAIQWADEEDNVNAEMDIKTQDQVDAEQIARWDAEEKAAEQEARSNHESIESIELVDVSESFIPPTGEIFESLDYKHGQQSNKKFTPIPEKELLPGILAKYEGPAFFLNSISRNRRFYSAKVWENAIRDPAFLDKLERRVMYGGIGHDVKITEEALRTGMVSHIVSAVEIKEDGIGYATYEILDTASGRELNTYLSARNGLKTSTRAYGRPLKGRKNRNEDLPRDIEEIDPDNFSFVGIDFVIDPGFLGSETM